MADLTEEELQALYAWIDEIPLSRQKKNITRDFSDGVLAAEVVSHFLPKLVELHNYTPANSTPQKLDNWKTLNRKVFSRLNFTIPDDLLQDVTVSKPGVIEFILCTLRTKIERYLQNREDARKECGPSEDFIGTVYGEPYDPTHLPSNYGSGGPFVYNPKEPVRHPGPAQLPEDSHLPHHERQGRGRGREGGHPMHYPHPSHLHADTSHHGTHGTQYLGQDRPHLHVTTHAGVELEPHPKPHLSSRIPPPNHHVSQMRQKTQLHKSSLAAPTLPPVNPGNTVSLMDARTLHRGLSNPEKRTKIPNYEKRHTYANNPRKTLLPLKQKQQEDSAGMKIRIAEKDQKLLESQEYIQLLQMKVTRLEHLVRIKDMKIGELATQLGSIRHPFQKR